MTTRTKVVSGVIIVLILGGGTFYGFNRNKGSAVSGNGNTSVSTSSQTITSYFGNMVKGDFNGDGKQDQAFIVTQTTGGSGTFFYLAHTLGGEAILLGDRIAPQSTQWKNGEITVNYAERKPGEPMTTQPSVGVSRSFKGVGKNLVEIKNTSGTSTQTSTKITGYLTGHVTTSPTCPVESIPPTSNCAPRAYVTEIRAIKKLSAEVIAKTTTNAEGLYKMELPSGDYTITTKGGSVYPRCADKDITVRENKTVTLDISCDSGIR